MITQAVAQQRLAHGVTRGLISMLHKDDAQGRLTNWQPITLLNVAYKLFAKAL